MERLSRKIAKLDRALQKLKEAFGSPPWQIPEDLLVEVRIKRFEYTFGALWQAALTFLRERGLECASPRSCFEGLLREGLVSPEDKEALAGILKIRNTWYTFTMKRPLGPSWKNFGRGRI